VGDWWQETIRMTLHPSPKTENNKHRRVIHLEFINRKLPEGIEWLKREGDIS
jgi:hypothetical protein